MTKRSALPRSLTLVAIAAAIPLAACGSDSKSASKDPAKLNVTATESGKTVNVAVTGDKTPGTTQLTFTNNGKKPHAAQLIAVTGTHTDAEVKKAYDAVSNGKAAPPWLFAAGGTGTTAPGKVSPVGLVLNEGTYYVAGESDDSTPVGLTKLVIKGSTNEAKLPTGPTITAKEYAFTASGLKSGTNTVVFTNAGKQWHHLQAFPLNKGATLAQAKKFFETQGNSSGPPPVDFKTGVGTAVIEGGGSITTDLSLKKGKYAFVCFVSDKQGGPPHVAKGMITEATVN
jgi:hypothetical protein